MIGAAGAAGVAEYDLDGKSFGASGVHKNGNQDLLSGASATFGGGTTTVRWTRALQGPDDRHTIDPSSKVNVIWATGTTSGAGCRWATRCSRMHGPRCRR